jgi:hypothetical protein
MAACPDGGPSTWAKRSRLGAAWIGLRRGRSRIRSECYGPRSRLLRCLSLVYPIFVRACLAKKVRGEHQEKPAPRGWLWKADIVSVALTGDANTRADDRSYNAGDKLSTLRSTISSWWRNGADHRAVRTVARRSGRLRSAAARSAWPADSTVGRLAAQRVRSPPCDSAHGRDDRAQERRSGSEAREARSGTADA